MTYDYGKKATEKRPRRPRTQKNVVVEANGMAFIRATFNNVIVTLTDQYGNCISWSSSGKEGFKDNSLILYDSRRMKKDLYLVSPRGPLPPGEYAMMQIPRTTQEAQTHLTPRRIFDFSVR